MKSSSLTLIGLFSTLLVGLVIWKHHKRNRHYEYIFNEQDIYV